MIVDQAGTRGPGGGSIMKAGVLQQDYISCNWIPQFLGKNDEVKATTGGEDTRNSQVQVFIK